MDTLDGLRVTNKELNDRKARLEDIQKARAEAVKSTESSSQSAESAEQGGNTEEQAPDDVSSVAGNGAVETNSEDAALTGVRANEAQSAEAANTETSEDESVDVGDTTPTLSNVVRILYNYGKKVAAKLFSQKFFDVAKTPDFMKKLGLTGGKFTIRYGVIARHAGKDEQHNLPVDIWEQLPEALQHPFAITKYYVDAEKKKQKGYRIYTSLQLKDGSYVVVGVEVRNGGRDLEVNSIDTVFGKRKNSELIGNDDVIYRSEEITPEQSSLLNEPNPRQYPTEQELSTDKGNETSGKTSVSEKKSESGSADTSYFPTDKYGVTPDEELSTMLLEIMEEVGATKENFVVDTSSGITDYNDGLLIDKDGIAVIRFEPNTAEMINGERGVTYAAYFLAALVYTDEYRHRLFDYDKREELIDAFNKSVGREVAFDCDSGMGYAFFFNIEDARRFKEFADKYLAKQNGQSKTDAQGNPLNEDGTLKVDVVKSIEELTDEDFTSPTRSVQLPAIPSVVDNAIGANGKPVIIKKNIFERNSENHPEVTPQHAREILVSALYRPDLYGQNQKARRPYNWIIINTKDSGGHNRLVVLEVNANKDNVEIVHWYSVDDRGVEKIKRQAQREGGHILILPSETEEAGALSGRQSGLSSESKDTETSGNGNQSSKKQAGEKQSKPKAQSKAKTDGEKIEDVGEKIAEARKEAKDLYERVLSGNFDELTLRKLNEYIDDATNRNRHYRPLSQRLPERALLSLSKDDRTAAVDALFSRICESTVPANGRTRAEGRRKIEARKEELLEAWANATGNWHESIADFTKEAEPIRSGTDSDVYLSDDGTKVIKASKGKFDNRKHPSDIDQVPLFNSVFPGSAYRILGYGRLNGKFVRFLEQPFVDFSTTTPLTTEERVEYMRSLGFEPQNEERTMFSNGEIVVSDLQKSNIVKGEDGNVWVIDADVKLHTKDLGGNYTYAPVETDTDTAELMTVYHGSGAKFDRIEFLRNGTTVYGAAVGGKILLNAEHLNPNTPVHEYTHLWDKAVQQKNPELWRRGVELMKQTSLWKEVENDPNYAGLDENGIASEVHSRLTGDKGAAELERMSREVLDGNGGIIDKASKMSVIQKLRKWLSDFWYWVKDTMTSWSKDEADKVSIEDFVNMPLADLAKGTRLNESTNEGGIRFHIVTDKKEIDRLNSEPTMKVYRGMQLIDGKLYPPMSAKVNGEWREGIAVEDLGKVWEKAEENPELADGNGYFKLDKGNKSSLKARYNPYIHTSTTPLNDQFSSAQSRPELVTVEVEIPKSELTSGYKAEKAKDSVGKVEWKAGVIQSQLTGTRTVILSRWDKPVRIVPDSEVADVIVKMFGDRKITMPSNVVTPSLRAELEKRGVPFVETNNTGKPVTRFREDEIAAMETPILESKGAFKSLAEAEQWAKKNLQGKSYTNNFTNDEVYISGKSVSEMLNPKSAKKINVRTHLAALQSVPEFIKTGIPAEIHTDTHGRGYDVMRLYNAIIINDELYRVKSTVKRVPQGDIYYTYEIQKMELIEGSDNTVGSLRGTYLIPKSSSVNSISGAKLLKGVKKTNSDELILPEDEDIRFRTVFGGNSGYVGYSMSKRAAQAREEGRYPKTDFKKVYDIPSNTFDILVSAGVIDDSEWHHTSSWGNRTTFYKWDEWEDYEGADYERRNRNRDVYEQNRKEINNMVKAFQKELKEKYPEDGENPYNNNPLSEEATAAVNAENDRYYNELDNGVVNYDNWYDDQFRRAKAEHNERLKEIYDNLSPEDKAIQEETAKYYEWLKASVDKSDNREKARSEFAEKIKDYFNKKAEELSSEERDRRNEGSPVTNHLLSRDGMREAVVELSESLGVEVEFVRDSELPEGHRGAMGMWRNGKVYVCLEFLRRSTFAKENRTELFNGKCHHKCFKGSLSCETYQ